MVMHIGGKKNRSSTAAWLSFFFTAVFILALIAAGEVYLPLKFQQLRQELNTTLQEELTANTSEVNQRLQAIETKINQLGLLKEAVDVEEMKNQEQVLQVKLESLQNEIAAHKATIENLTGTIADYKDEIASLDWRKRQLEKAIQEAQAQLEQ